MFPAAPWRGRRQPQKLKLQAFLWLFCRKRPRVTAKSAVFFGCPSHGREKGQSKYNIRYGYYTMSKNAHSHAERGRRQPQKLKLQAFLRLFCRKRLRVTAKSLCVLYHEQKCLLRGAFLLDENTAAVPRTGGDSRKGLLCKPFCGYFAENALALRQNPPSFSVARPAGEKKGNQNIIAALRLLYHEQKCLLARAFLRSRQCHSHAERGRRQPQ